MISDLPKAIQQEVLKKLALGQFRQAKHIHDKWIAEHSPEKARKPA